MKALVKSANEDKSVSQVEFGVLSIDDVVQLSHVRVYNNDIYDAQQKPIENGLMDPRMGPSDKNKCPVCEGDQKTCMGHFGHISLSNYLFPFGFLKDIVKVLKCICKCCGHILLSEDDLKSYEKNLKRPNLSYIAKKSLRLEIIKKSSKIRTCRVCNSSNGNVKKVKSLSMIYHCKYILKDKLKRFVDQFENHPEDIQKLINNGIELLRPYDVFKLFQRIPMKHYKFLGMSAKDNLKFSNLIFKHITVPPNCIRPSSLTGVINQSREDDITILLRMQLGDNKLHDMHNEYARMINPNASCIRSNKDKKFIRGMVQRLAGKKGRFRGNIMGKRTNFTSRTVISPDPYLKIDEVSIPEYCAVRLTFTEKVTSYNFNYLKGLVLNGPHKHPGAVAYASLPKDFQQKPMSHLKVMMTADIKWQKLDKEAWREMAAQKMRIGDFVERHIDNGDVVLFNRQPSLHRLSFQSFKVTVKKAKTFSFNPCCCNPFNADFDGDEMNIHFPQTYEAKSEANELISSVKNITSPNSGDPLTSPLQDILTATFLLTSKDSFFTRGEFFHLALRVLRNLPKGKEIILPLPAILKPVKLYTGKQLISFVISLTSTWYPESQQMIPDSRINHIVEITPKSNEDLSADDSFVYIHNSELMLGQLTKKLLGGGSKSSIFYRLLRDVSEEDACRSMERLCQVALTDLKNRGFSIGITDVAPGAKLQEIKDRLVVENFQICENFIKSYEEGTLVCDPGCSLEETLETKISGQLSKIRDEGGTQCRANLPKRNAPLIMAVCGSKGSNINISQMILCVGQQIIEGKRIGEIKGTNRTLIFCPKNCRSPMSRGFVSNSFYSGLNPVEFKFHAMSGREGLIDTAVKTAETGYMQRRLIKCLEDLAIRFDNTVRDFEGNLVQFQYGIDGNDPSKLENTTSPCDFKKELHNALRDYRYSQDLMFRDSLTALDNILANRTDQFTQLKSLIRDTIESYINSYEGSRFGITHSQLELFVDNCYKKYQRAVIEPGTAIGVICGQSVGEPATQMTLKTFHFAGVASMNITQGVPRMQEIMNAVANIKTRIITVHLTDAYNDSFAKKMQLKIHPVLLKDLIVQSQEVLCSAGMFFYIHLNNREINRLSITQEDIQNAIPIFKNSPHTISVVFKDNDRMYIEVFSEQEINCQLMLNVLGKIQVLGIKNTKRTVIQKNKEGLYNIYVDGGKLLDLFQIEGIDGTKTHSNHILETYEVLGIDAAKDTIINEFNAVMGAHNLTPDMRHVMLLADIMCYTGQVCGFQRSGMSKSKNSVLCLASFERTVDHLYEAAFHNQQDKLHGISDCLTFGKTIPLGTGMHSLMFNQNISADNDNKNLKK